MRPRTFAASLAALLIGAAGPALAQSRIVIDADAPIVEAQINNRPVRLEVDLQLPDALALSEAAAQRLHVQRVPFLAVRVGIEGGEATIRGRIARPRLVFDAGASRAFAGIFRAPVTDRADGVIGPGALPHDVVVVRLGPEQPGEREIVIEIENADDWKFNTQVGGRQLVARFNVADQASVFNRTAARAFDAAGEIPAAGELAEKALVFGLRTLMQPVSTELHALGLPLTPAFARTNAPLLGATEAEDIVVTGQADDPPPPSVTIGRAALSRCSSITVERRSRRMTLRCA